MDEFYKPQNGPIYHRYPYPPEWRNAIPKDLSDANETGHSTVLASTYQLPTTSSVRSPRFHEVHEPQAQSQSRLQPRSSPTISDVPPCSPKRQRTSDSMAITGSFPLPYKPPSASHLTSNQLPRTTSSLTSQDTYSYQRTPFQHNTGGVYGYEPDRLVGSTSFRDAKFSPPTVTTGQSTWNAIRPESRPQDRGHSGSRNGNRRGKFNRQHTPRSEVPYSGKDSSVSPGSSSRTSPDIHTSRLYGLSHIDQGQHGANKAGATLYLASCPLPSKFLDDNDDHDQFLPVASRGGAKCTFRYIAASDADDSIRPIWETPYWPEMRDDPIFHDLSKDGSVVPIKELVARRTRILSNHVLLPPVMSEKGTQTDFDTPTPPTSVISIDREMEFSMDHPRAWESAGQVPEVTESIRTHNTHLDFRRENSFPRRKVHGTRKSHRAGKNAHGDVSISPPRHKSRNLKRPRSTLEDYEDTFDRPEANINTSPRLQDTSVYSRRW